MDGANALNEEQLTKVAEACRRGLMSLSQSPHSMFSGFPVACCGPASEIVGLIIEERFGITGTYVCCSGHRDMIASQTHAWVEVAGFIVDVTHDQCENTGLAGWVFSQARAPAWYRLFSERDERPGFCTPSGWPAYPHDGYAAADTQVQLVLDTNTEYDF